MAPFFFGSGGNSVLVYTTKDQYNPGECIQGFAHVNIITGTNFSGLFLKVSGKERLRFDDYETYYVPHVERYYRDGKWHDRHTTRAVKRRVDRYGKHTLFKTEFMLLAGGQLVPGQYTVPFNFLLPLGLPGSFSLTASDFECGIEYSVKALVRVPGIFKCNLRSIRPFEVRQAAPSNIQSISASANSDIDICCCFNRGQAHLSFRCTRDSFFCGESVSLVASAINNSTADLKRLTVKLRRYIKLRADSGHSKSCEYTISEEIYPAVPANTSAHEIPMSLYIPSDAPQQCFGAKIRCLYSVRLSGKVKCGTDATCTVPAFIYRPQSVNAFVLPADPSWNPVLLAPVEIVSSAPAAIPEPISLSQYPGAETMHPSAPTEFQNPNPIETNLPNQTNQVGISPAQQALDGAFFGK
jgi:hypothetical protein